MRRRKSPQYSFVLARGLPCGFSNNSLVILGKRLYPALELIIFAPHWTLGDRYQALYYTGYPRHFVSLDSLLLLLRVKLIPTFKSGQQLVDTEPKISGRGTRWGRVLPFSYGRCSPQPPSRSRCEALRHSDALDSASEFRTSISRVEN